MLELYIFTDTEILHNFRQYNHSKKNHQTKKQIGQDVLF